LILYRDLNKNQKQKKIHFFYHVIHMYGLPVKEDM